MYVYIYVCIYDMFFSEIKTHFANYADGTTSYTCDLQIDTVIETLDKNAEKLFQWFYNKFLMANPENYHFLTSNSEKMTSQRILSSSSQKLLGIHVTAKSSFGNLFKILCRKASQKLNALSRSCAL